MSANTLIQWCDSSINPIMGYSGCELLPPAATVLKNIDKALKQVSGAKVSSREIFEGLLDWRLSEMPPDVKSTFPSSTTLDTVHICRLMEDFLQHLAEDHSKDAATVAESAIRQSITCYADLDHSKKELKITKPNQAPHKGLAPRFLTVSRFPGRMSNAANWSDLYGTTTVDKPWRNGLPRLIFVSEMDDAFSSDKDFGFLESDAIPAVCSDQGKRHIWIWLTKQPARMARFAKRLEGGFPENVCAMTTVTSRNNLNRVDLLRNVDARIKGLSLEPLIERIPPEELNLAGIDWLIVGGESGSRKAARPFPVEWALELKQHCEESHVAFFLKQVGRNPMLGGKPMRLNNPHGGDWQEWQETWKKREFPKAFYDYRNPPADEDPAMDESMESTDTLTVCGDEIVGEIDDYQLENRRELFERLNGIVERGVKCYWETGRALTQIQQHELWKDGGFVTWEQYCRNVVGHSRVHAFRIMQATEFVDHLETLPDGNTPLPVNEAQVRPLLQLPSRDLQVEAWASCLREIGKQPTGTQVKRMVDRLKPPNTNAPRKLAPSPAQQRLDTLAELKTVIERGGGLDEILTLVEKLEGLLKQSSMARVPPE